ncbi:MAG: hypothetical protein J7M25_17455 [Deltaproteobacteria bacterium]|nr:hypothetical protein [Deltaproteobacteria bacterium]
MRKLIAAVAAAALLGSSGMALAQGAAGYVKKKVFDFQGDDIEGSLLSPSGEFLGGDLKPNFKTLIEYRYDFTPEMVKSAEDI